MYATSLDIPFFLTQGWEVRGVNVPSSVFPILCLMDFIGKRRFGRCIASLLWPRALSWGVGVIPAGGISSQREMDHERIRERRENTPPKEGSSVPWSGV